MKFNWSCPALLFTATALPLFVAAQPYPNKSIRMIVTFPAGGGTDFMGRVIGQKLAERVGQRSEERRVGKECA